MTASLFPIESVYIRNFRGVREQRIELHPKVTVLFGNNAGGKTTVLDALALALAEIPRAFLGGDANTREFQSRSYDIRSVPGDNGLSSSSIMGFAHVEVKVGSGQWGVYDLRSPAHSLPMGLVGPEPLLDMLRDDVRRVHDGDLTAPIPMVASYGTERSVVQVPLRERNFAESIERLDALNDSLNAVTHFKTVFEWFRVMQELENQRARESGDLDYELPELAWLKLAIEEGVPGCHNPRLDLSPPRMLVDFDRDGVSETLDITQLSDGYRTHLALVMDLARRLVQANPSSEIGEEGRGTKSPGVVLIDEIDLHLHPVWQGEVINQLREAFPNIQFVISTHSEQVIASVLSDQVRRVGYDGGEIVVHEVPFAQGATNERILAQLMDAPRRIPGEVTSKLEQYFALVNAGHYDANEALELREDLEEALGNDPVFDELDKVKRNRSFVKRLTQERP